MAQRAEVVLDDEQWEVLERWARRPKSSQALALRCRIVLAAAEGLTAVTHAIGRDSGIRSDSDELSTLFGHCDLPVLRPFNPYGTKLGADHALARENAFQRNRMSIG